MYMYIHALVQMKISWDRTPQTIFLLGHWCLDPNFHNHLCLACLGFVARLGFVAWCRFLTNNNVMCMLFQRLKCGACLGTQMKVQICGPVSSFWGPVLVSIFGSHLWVHYWGLFLGSIFGVHFWDPILGFIFSVHFWILFWNPLLGSIFGDLFWVQILDFGVQFLDPNLDPFLGPWIWILLFFNRGPFLGAIFGVRKWDQIWTPETV